MWYCPNCKFKMTDREMFRYKRTYPSGWCPEDDCYKKEIKMVVEWIGLNFH